MSLARIYLTGRVTIETDGAAVEPSAFPGRQGRLAFVRLAAEPRRVERETLAEALWPGGLPDGWDGALSAVVSKVRKTLDRVDLGQALESADGCYELRFPQGTWIDLRAAVNALDKAEGALRRDDAAEAWANATVASAILRRRFLPGESGPWVDGTRRRLLDLEVRTYDVLAGAWLLRGDGRQAVEAARRAVDLAPFRESTYARLMEAHLAAGDRAEAVRVYGEVRDLLVDEMGIEPADRVQALYERALG